MLNRREFILGGLSAGLALGSASMISGCSGLKRADLPGKQATLRPMKALDNRAESILYHASLAPSGHNSQPWRVRIEGSDSWIIEADEMRRLPCVDPENRELLLSMGAFVENMALAAGTVGLGTDIQVIARDATEREMVRAVLYENRPTRYPLQRITQRRTVKHGQLPKELTAVDVRALSESMRGHLFYFPRGSNHAACMRDAAVDNYRIQAERDDAQRELVRWLRLNNQTARRHRDGLSTEGMEITGFNGWLVRNFARPEDFLKESYRQKGVDLMASLAGQGGGWMVITSRGESVADLIETGRRFQRMALLARERGIGIHPMTQTLEEKKGMATITGNHDSRFLPQFILRVGYLERYPQPVSLRRPVAWFVYA